MSHFVEDRFQMEFVPLRAARQEVKRLTDEILRGAKHQVGKDSGKLRASLRSGIHVGVQEVTGQVGSDSRHALVHHTGSRRHRIVPRGPGYPLHFYWEKVGREVDFMSVRHPGTKPNRYLTDSLKLFGRLRGFRVIITPNPKAQYYG